MKVSTFEDVKAAVRADDEGKWDKEVPVENISYSNGCIFVRDDVTEKPLTDWAMGQLCNKMGVPTLYFRRCPNPLQVEQTEHWLHGKYGETACQGKTFLLRFKKQDARSVLSDRYTVFNNKDVTDTLDKLDSDLGRLSVPSFDLSDLTFQVTLTFDESEMVKISDVGTTCIRVFNSEVGARAVEIVYVMYVKETGATIQIPRRFADKAYRHKHIGIDREELLNAVKDAVRGLPGISKMMEFAISQAGSKAVEEKVWKVIEEKAGEAWVKKVQEALAGKADWTVWNVAETLATLAQNDAEITVEKKVELDGIAGELLLNA